MTPNCRVGKKHINVAKLVKLPAIRAIWFVYLAIHEDPRVQDTASFIEFCRRYGDLLASNNPAGRHLDYWNHKQIRLS